jgi:hypothetical protein
MRSCGRVGSAWSFWSVVSTLATAMLLAMLRTLVVCFIGGLMIAAVISVFLIDSIVWTDCLHDNSHHTCGDALLFAAVSPVYSAMVGMVVYFLPLIVGAAFCWSCIGRLLSRSFRCLHLWYLMANCLFVSWPIPHGHHRGLAMTCIHFASAS